MISLTPRARQMLAFVVTMHRQDMPWTYREAALHLGEKSRMRPHHLVGQLVDRGYVRRSRGRVIPLPAALAAVPAMQMTFIPAPHQVSLG